MSIIELLKAMACLFFSNRCGKGSNPQPPGGGTGGGGGTGTPPPKPPVITLQPQSVTANEGAVVTFTVTVTGTPPLTYVWRKNGVPIVGLGTPGSSYTTPVLTLGDSGAKYSVVITNAAGTATSNDATLTVTPISHGVKPWAGGIFGLLPSDPDNNSMRLPDLMTAYPEFFTGPINSCVRYRGKADTIFPTSNRDDDDWAKLTELFNLCRTNGKRVGMNIAFGLTTPQWIYDLDPSMKYQLADTSQGIQFMPIPWNPIYKQALFGLIDVMAARYENDPVLAYVVLGGFMQAATINLGDLNDETALNARAIADGFASVQEAWTTCANDITNKFLSAFPTTPLQVTTPNALFPDDNVTGRHYLQSFELDGGMFGELFNGLRAKVQDNPAQRNVTFPKYQQMFAPTSRGNPPGSDDYVPADLPVPIPPDPYTLQQVLLTAALEGTMGVECYYGDVSEPANSSTFIAATNSLVANIPGNQSPPLPTGTYAFTNIGSPPDDPGCAIAATLYIPDITKFPGPYHCIVGTVAGGFYLDGNALDAIFGDAVSGLVSQGYLCLFPRVRLGTDPHPHQQGGPIPGQTTDGEYKQQSDDLHRAVRFMRNDPGGLGFKVTGKVGALGVSASAGHAVVMATEGTPGDDKADFAIALSPPLDYSDRDPDTTTGTPFIIDTMQYCRETGNPPNDPAVLARVLAKSPISLSLATAKPILHYNGTMETMPYSQFTKYGAAMLSASAPGYDPRPNNTDPINRAHAGAMWTQVRPQTGKTVYQEAFDWLKTILP